MDTSVWLCYTTCDCSGARRNHTAVSHHFSRDQHHPAWYTDKPTTAQLLMSAQIKKCSLNVKHRAGTPRLEWYILFGQKDKSKKDETNWSRATDHKVKCCTVAVSGPGEPENTEYCWSVTYFLEKFLLNLVQVWSAITGNIRRELLPPKEADLRFYYSHFEKFGPRV